jgi:FkbM family methyltransferase
MRLLDCTPRELVMTWKRRTAELAVRSLDRVARLPGEGFYHLFLDEIGRRQVDFGATVACNVAGQTVRFSSPNQLTRWRVETLLTKEPATIGWIDRFEQGEVLWDVGANIGIYSVYAAIARGARVLAFEPLPANYAVLAKTIEINGLAEQVTPLAIALAGECGLGSLHMRTTEPGAAFAAFDTSPAAGIRLQCLGYSIDRCIADLGVPFPTHVKIDVDGAEQSILDGAAQTLSDSRLKSLAIEFDLRQAEQGASMEKTLARHGLTCVGVHGSPLFPTSPARNHFFARLPEAACGA